MRHSAPDHIQEYLVMLMAGESLSPQQRRQLDAWIQAAPDRTAYVAELQSTWRVLGRRDLPLPGPRALDVTAARARAPLGVARPAPFRRRVASVVAGLAAAALIFAVQHQLGRRATGAAQEYTTAAGETSNVRLDDGTLVRLAPGSRLIVTRGSGGRDVRLAGRAFFAVTHREAAPFRVHTRMGDVKVLGTRFDVSDDGARLDLTVVDGRVALSAGAEPVEVVGGETSHAANGDVAPAVAAVNVFATLGWMGQTMMFNATPLPRVADEIGHRYGVAITVAPELAGHTVTAVFNDRPLSDVMDVLCGLLDATCELAPDRRSARIAARHPGRAAAPATDVR